MRLHSFDSDVQIGQAPVVDRYASREPGVERTSNPFLERKRQCLRNSAPLRNVRPPDRMATSVATRRRLTQVAFDARKLCRPASSDVARTDGRRPSHCTARFLMRWLRSLRRPIGIKSLRTSSDTTATMAVAPWRRHALTPIAARCSATLRSSASTSASSSPTVDS